VDKQTTHAGQLNLAIPPAK